MPATIKDPTPISMRNGHSRCLLCGDLNPRSLKLLFSPLEDGSVDARLTVDAELQGYDGFLHGGVIASFLDAAMTHCLFHQGIQALTGDLHVRFVKPVPIGVTLDIRAWVLLSYPPLYRLRAEINVNEHKTAWAEAKFMEHQF